MDDDGAPLVLDELAAALVALPPLGPWVLEASCAGLGFEGAAVFVAEGRLDREELEVARAVCAGCPVVRECSAYAAQTPVYGLWGGRWYADIPGLTGRGEPSRAVAPRSARPSRRRRLVPLLSCDDPDVGEMLRSSSSRGTHAEPM